LLKNFATIKKKNFSNYNYDIIDYFDICCINKNYLAAKILFSYQNNINYDKPCYLLNQFNFFWDNYLNKYLRILMIDNLDIIRKNYFDDSLSNIFQEENAVEEKNTSLLLSNINSTFMEIPSHGNYEEGC
ncbi:MAG TPA: hypothetical protein QKA14_00295, partial [Candidatus Megaira endosymbiont of Hartmannula sinica]|nr:hypothetical protein [Candidatus Megaera endosymbiont of Hartmannula sinica]